MLVFFVFFGCKINKTKNKMRVGLWIEKYDIDNVAYKSKGKYKRDEEVKTWKFFKNKKIYKIEKYKNDVCFVTYFYPNGKIESQGQSRTTLSATGRHWFYFGDWCYYSENGTINLIRTYENGVQICEIDKF